MPPRAAIRDGTEHAERRARPVADSGGRPARCADGHPRRSAAGTAGLRRTVMHLNHACVCSLNIEPMSQMLLYVTGSKKKGLL